MVTAMLELEVPISLYQFSFALVYQLYGHLGCHNSYSETVFLMAQAVRSDLPSWLGHHSAF